MNGNPVDLLYPLIARNPTWWERYALRTGRCFGFCTVCGHKTVFERFSANFRETGLCRHCQSSNRRRQIGWIASRAAAALSGKKIKTLAALSRLVSLSIYNTESAGPIHDSLKTMPNYVCSEFFGAEHRSGEMVRGILHQDLQSCSFDSDRFDLVLSTDVWEHIPNPYQAHREIYRILKRGGRHIFTVPFYQTRYRDEIRSRVEEDGAVRHDKDPWYHDDPVRPDQGTLVFRIFSMEMLVRLEEIGFQTLFYQLYAPRFGILGANALVFEAIKESSPG